MKSPIRFLVGLAAVLALAGSVGFAQSSGEAIYKSKCQNCHGTDGMANSGVGKVMKVKPVTDAEVRKMSEPEMIEATRAGMGKMQAYKGSLTDAQIHDSVLYFRTFLK